jgi:hypothetical protein
MPQMLFNIVFMLNKISPCFTILRLIIFLLNKNYFALLCNESNSFLAISQSFVALSTSSFFEDSPTKLCKTK